VAFTIFTIFSFSWRNASLTPRNVTTRDRKWQLHLLSPLLCRRVHFVSVNVITDYDLPPFNPPDVNSQFLCGRSAQQEEVPGACPTVFPRLQGRTQFLYRLIIDFRHRLSSECSNLIASHFLIIPLDREQRTGNYETKHVTQFHALERNSSAYYAYQAIHRLMVIICASKLVWNKK
jgi:hypothetical protein